MTSAIVIALRLSGVGPGDEVLTTAFACMATNSAIAQCGAIPVWVDLCAKSTDIDVQDFDRKITSSVKAAILYHVAGYVGPSREIAKICGKHKIKLIEDCDNALFALQDERHVGVHADFCVYSFYPNRQINTAEGGALVCKSAEDANRAKKLRRFGIDAKSFRNSIGEIDPSVDIHEIGWSYTMNNLCAAMGYAQLASAPTRATQTRRNAKALERLLDNMPGVELAPVARFTNPAYWAFLVFVSNRDEIIQKLKADGIHTSSLHQRNDGYSCFDARHRSKLPNTEYFQKHVLALPCGWWLSEDDISSIAKRLRNAVASSV